MNHLPAIDALPASIDAYGRAQIASDVDQLRPHAEILDGRPGLTRGHLAAAALALVASVDADLESLAVAGPEVEPRDVVHRVRRLCERRDGLLSHAGTPQSRDEARGHFARSLLRVQVMRSPLESPGQPSNALAGLARSWGAVGLGGRARKILADAFASAAPMIRQHAMTASPAYQEFRRLEGDIDAASRLATFSGDRSSPAAALAGSLRGEADRLRARAEAEAGRVVAGLAARVDSGDLVAFVESMALFEASGVHPNAVSDMRERLLCALTGMRGRFLDALVDEGAERFVPIPPDWPKP